MTQHELSILLGVLADKYAYNIAPDTAAENVEADIREIKHGVSIDLSQSCIVLSNGFNQPGHENGLDLRKNESWSSLMLLLALLDKGYSPKSIFMEKTYHLGRNNNGRVDFYVSDAKGENSFMIDAKTNDEFDLIIRNKKKVKQLFSYAKQESSVSRVAYYTYDFENQQHRFASVNYNNYKECNNVEEAARKFTGDYSHKNFILDEEIFGRPSANVIQHENLKDLLAQDISRIKLSFLEILRINVVSDKPGAFMVFVNLLLCKIYDEKGECDVDFTLRNNSGESMECKGVMFQYVQDFESDECLMKRLQDLFKTAAQSYLKQDILDYSDDEINKHLGKNPSAEIKRMFDDLRLKRNNPFAFVEVYNDKTFSNNAVIVKSVVSLLQNYKFKYNFRQQFLGDFFEELLVTSLKQDEGQFFTPVPLVDFIVEAIPLNEWMQTNFGKRPPIRELPRVIDYAAGAGHFLISYMDRMENILHDDYIALERKYSSVYSGVCYDWVKSDNVVGIEKDYRLAKTAKVASFFNGDGEMCMVTGDGLNKFNSDEYSGTCLQGQGVKREIFDFVLSNPPFSVKGFKQNLTKLAVDENDFSILSKIQFNDTSSEIEVLFVERAWQLLKNKGLAVILLPQSVLSSSSKYETLRRFILKNFHIRAMLLTADITFFKTSTSPVTLFLEKSARAVSNYDYPVLLMYSEKYRDTSASKKKEEEFLGYKFSNNKNCPSISTFPQGSVLHKKLLPIVKKFLANGRVSQQSDCHEIKPLKSILLNNDSFQIFPRYMPIANGQSLDNFFDCMIETAECSDAMPYVEIGDINDGRITKLCGKKKSGTCCKKGDILISVLTPTKNKVCVAENSYVVSGAIAVLRIKKEHKKDFDVLYKKLKSDGVLRQMNTLLEGFKITYAKISIDNMMKYVQLPM